MKFRLQFTVQAEELTPTIRQRYRGIVFRGYDTSALHWKDEILRIRHLEAEIADMQKEIERFKKQAAASERRFHRLMKEMGITDPPKTEDL